ncbi:hypothetical protein IFR04_004879 [Cadophora malorum]|uniref:Cupin type-2 domain-containing protein n=1 Tax=Cadophora malorum TaxID=108018 RepID=A0A8H7WBZ1_9HELO|nr:hypothetical protein IFR04_004879 [Cadophora malorum]
MSSHIQELQPLSLGKGISMRSFVDTSKTEDSPGYNWSEVLYEGKDGDDLLEVPAHWHRDHDEVMEILEGSMSFTIDGKKRIVSAGDPPILIKRGQVHSITAIKGVRTRATERTIPSGTFKALFFQDLLQYDTMPGFFMTMRVFYDGDCYAALPGGFKMLDYAFITVMGLIAKPFVAARPKGVKFLK